MFKSLTLISFFIFSFSVLVAQKDTNNTFHLKKVKIDTALPKGDYGYIGPLIQSQQRQPIHLTICGKDSGEITIAELKKCKGIFVGGWNGIGIAIVTGFGPNDIPYYNSRGDNVTSFEFCIKHLKATTILTANNALLTDNMTAQIKNLTPGDSIFIRHVEYNDAVKGPSSLPPIGLKVVKKESAVKTKE